MTTHREPWLSRKTWRRLLELHATGRITGERLDALKRRLARVRGAATPARLPPRLVVLRGGRAAPTPPRLVPTPREAA